MSLPVLEPHSERIYYIAIGMIPGIGYSNAKQLISYCGGPENVFKTSKQKLLKIPGLGPNTVMSILNSNKQSIIHKAQIEWEQCIANNIQVITYNDNAYPKRLLHCKDAPYLIYVKGEADLNNQRMISIVGTRKITQYGKSIVKQIVNQLEGYGISVVSGLAYGVDGHTHRNCLEVNIPTIGVLAHGLDIIYPSIHRKMAQRMLENKGALISEFKFGTKPDRQNFPSRNRIVAGMCDATVVIESASKGGALITAEIANGYHRDVYAVSGRINDKYSEGCNWLIQNNIAGLITSGNDLLRNLGWQEHLVKNKPKVLQRSLFTEMDEHEKVIYQYLESANNKIHVDELNRKLKMTRSSLAAGLLNMELKGILLSTPGNCFQLA